MNQNCWQESLKDEKLVTGPLTSQNNSENHNVICTNTVKNKKRYEKKSMQCQETGNTGRFEKTKLNTKGTNPTYIMYKCRNHKTRSNHCLHKSVPC